MRESHSQEIKGNLSSPVARFSVTGLEPGALYQTALFSYNSKGRSEPVVLQAATLRLPEKQLTAEKGMTTTSKCKLYLIYSLASAFLMFVLWTWRMPQKPYRRNFLSPVFMLVYHEIFIRFIMESWKWVQVPLKNDYGNGFFFCRL